MKVQKIKLKSSPETFCLSLSFQSHLLLFFSLSIGLNADSAVRFSNGPEEPLGNFYGLKRLAQPMGCQHCRMEWAFWPAF